MSSSWLENIKNQHGNLIEEEEEEEEEKKVEEKPEESAKPQDEQNKNIEKSEKEAEIKQDPKNEVQEEPTEKEKFVYNGPSTRETVLFSKSFEKLTTEEEKSYVESLIYIRNSLTTVIDQTSKTLKNGSLLNSASKKSKAKYGALRKSILSLPVPHVAAVRKN